MPSTLAVAVPASASTSAASSAYSNFDMMVVLSPSPTVTPGFWRSCIREILCHSYKLMSAIVARRLMTTLEGHLPDTQAGFRPARGCRDNVCALKWFIEMILREGRQAVITFIDYSAAFDTESQMFLDEALAEAGVGAKVRRIVQAIFAAATGVVRLRHPDGTMTLSEPFDIARGILQGDIFSPVAFIARMMIIIHIHSAGFVLVLENLESHGI